MTSEREKTPIDAPSLREIVDLHVKASADLKLHREAYQAFLNDGDKASAQRALHRVQKLETVVRALQAQVRD
jgi:hypothetical protein